MNSKPIRYAWAATGMRPSETDFGATRYISEHQFDLMERQHSEELKAAQDRIIELEGTLDDCDAELDDYRDDLAQVKRKLAAQAETLATVNQIANTWKESADNAEQELINVRALLREIRRGESCNQSTINQRIDAALEKKV